MEIIGTLLASKLIKSIVTLMGGFIVSVLLHGFLGLFLRTLSHRSRLAAYQQRLDTLKTLFNSVISLSAQTVIKDGEDGGLTFIPNSEIKQVILLPKEKAS